MRIRISDNYLSQVMANDMNRSLSRMLELQRQASTMQRIHDFADDPRAVGAIQRYKALIAANDQYLRNLGRSGVIVEGTDAALQDMSSLLADVRELAMRELSAVATSDTRAMATTDVDSLVGRLLGLLNTTVEGNYIFGGTRSDRPPFVRNGATVIYQGNEDLMVTRTGPNTEQVLNIPGSEFMGAMSATLVGDADLAPRIQPGTALSQLNLGAGWTPGSITVRDGNDNAWTVNLSGAVTAQDVLDAINAATGGAVTASLDPGGQGFQLAGTGPISVEEVNGGQTASSLGLNGVSQADTFLGRDVRPGLDPGVALSDIAALEGMLPLGAIEVEAAGVITTVDFSGALTVADLQSSLEAALPGYQLRLDGSGLSIVSASTEPFAVRGVGTPDTAALLGIEGTGTPVRMFGVLEDLRAALAADDTEGIRASLVELEALEQMIQSQLVKVGGRQQDLEWTQALLMQRDTQLRSKLSLERDADVAQVSANLAQAEMSYQSSLLVTSRLFQANLMMYL